MRRCWPPRRAACIGGIAGIMPSVEMQSDEFAQKPILVSIRGEEIPRLKKYGAAAQGRRLPPSPASSTSS